VAEKSATVSPSDWRCRIWSSDRQEQGVTKGTNYLTTLFQLQKTYSFEWTGVYTHGTH